MPSSVPDAMYRRWELSIGLPLEILSDIADERARLGRRIDPDAVLIEDLEGGDRVLEDECQPWRLLVPYTGSISLRKSNDQIRLTGEVGMGTKTNVGLSVIGRSWWIV